MANFVCYIPDKVITIGFADHIKITIVEKCLDKIEFCVIETDGGEQTIYSKPSLRYLGALIDRSSTSQKVLSVQQLKHLPL